MNPVAKFREITGTENQDELDALVVEEAFSFGKLLDRHDAALDKLTSAQQADHSLERLIEAANAKLLEGLVVPALSAEQEGSSFSALMRFSNECQAKKRFNVSLFVPAQK